MSQNSPITLVLGALICLVFLAGGIMLFVNGERISGGLYLLAGLMTSMVFLSALKSEKEELVPAAEPVAPDDLTKIEGVGPKIGEILQAGGIRTFSDLIAAEPSRLRQMLEDAGSRFKLADPSTWPEQAGLAAAGDWERLEKLQDELKGGRRTT